MKLYIYTVQRSTWLQLPDLPTSTNAGRMWHSDFSLQEYGGLLEVGTKDGKVGGGCKTGATQDQPGMWAYCRYTRWVGLLL
jgi:hypothetical protein